MNNLNLSGTGVAVITPFKSNGAVDFSALEKTIDYLIDNKIKYLVALGTTAESSTVSEQEKQLILEVFIRVVNKRVPLILGLGGNNTALVVDQFQQINPLGFDAILSVSPFYNRPQQEGIYQHFKAIDRVTPLPILIYNVPGRTASNIAAETTLRLAYDCPNIIGIKEASGDLKQVIKIIKGKPDDFWVLSGDDETAIPMILNGGDGVISVIAGGFPQLFAEGVDAALSHHNSKALAIADTITPIVKLLFEEGNPAGIKSVLYQRGLCENELRLPLVKASKYLTDQLTPMVETFQ